MKSIQLGGVLVKGKKELPPKFTGPARYRGAKRIEQFLAVWSIWVAPRVKALLVP